MRIVSIDVRLVSIPLKSPYIFGRGSVEQFDNVVTFMHTEEGYVGVGECVTKALVTDIDEARRIVQEDLCPKVIGRDPSDIESIINTLRPYTGPDPATMAAIDLALWDLLGKVYDVPVFRLLGGEYLRDIPVDYTLALAAPEEMADKALSMMNKGYKTFVVKAGRGQISMAVERVRVVREAVGQDAKIRVDANASYRVDEALEFMKGVQDYEIEFIEQPIEPGNIEGLKDLAGKTGVPICIDEGLTNPEQAISLVKSGTVDVFNVGVPKVGGLLMAKRIAAIAEAADIPCILGGRLAYEVTRQAGRHFVVSTPIACTGLAHTGAGPASQALEDNITNEVVTYDDIQRGAGFITVGDAPGLGFTISNMSIERYSSPRDA